MTSPQDDYRTEDRGRLRDLLSAYCRAVDRRDPVGLAAVFHPDAAITKAGIVASRDDYVADVMRRHTAFAETSHQVTNMIIDFLSDDIAFSESWGLAVERHADSDVVFRVRYGDQMLRREGRWRIAQRLLVMDHVMSVPIDPVVATITAGQIRGVRSGADPIEVLRSRLLAP